MKNKQDLEKARDIVEKIECGLACPIHGFKYITMSDGDGHPASWHDFCAHESHEDDKDNELIYGGKYIEQEIIKALTDLRTSLTPKPMEGEIDEATKLYRFICGRSGDNPVAIKVIAQALASTRKDAYEEVARLAVRRMSVWLDSDWKRSQDFREGIEAACSWMAMTLRGKKVDEPDYISRRAIEYAMKKLGMTWESNRQRLSFYDYFDESIRSLIEREGR